MISKMLLNAVAVESALISINNELNLFKEVLFLDGSINKKSAVPGAFDCLTVRCVDHTGFEFVRVFNGCISVYDLRALFAEYLDKFNQAMIEKLLKL